MKLVERLQKRKDVLTGFLIATFLTACAGGVMIGGACEVYQSARLYMPDPVGANREFLDWFNSLDAGMLKVCRG